MSKNRTPLVLVETAKPAALPERDRALLDEMLEAYQVRRLGALRHHPKSVGRDLTVIAQLLAFTGAPPWRWTEQDFEAWCHHLGIGKGLAPATQRHYQATIRGFLQYLIENQKFRNEVRRLCGVDLVQICTSENNIPHVTERELSHERRAMTHDEITAFFAAIDEATREASRFATKNFRPLQRDKALFFTIYAAGLRVSEARGLNVESFQPNPRIPELGAFGFISVWGKGSRGSGSRLRVVAVDHASLPAMLSWYLDTVRPYFLVNADANEGALFLSERGHRLGLSTLETRFQAALDRAGLGGQNLTPHCLRHSSVTHGTLNGMSLEATRRKHGHAFGATTQGYTHFPDEMVGEEVERSIHRQFHGALAEDGRDDEA